MVASVPDLGILFTFRRKRGALVLSYYFQTLLQTKGIDELLA